MYLLYTAAVDLILTTLNEVIKNSTYVIARTFNGELLITNIKNAIA